MKTKFNIDINKSLFSNLLLKEILNRDIQIDKIEKTNIFKFKNQLLIENYLNLTPYNYGLILSNKYFSLQLLKENGIPVPKGKEFNIYDSSEALLFAKKIKFPIFLRLSDSGINAKSIKVNKSSFFIENFNKLSKHKSNIIIEKYVSGKNYRIFVTENGWINIIEKIYPFIVGDGKSSIYKLISNENIERINSGEFTIDPQNYFELNIIKASDVLKDDKKLEFKNLNMLEEGAIFRDVSIKYKKLNSIAKRVLRTFPKLSFITFDLLINNQGYFITEVYLSPGLNSKFPVYKNLKIEKIEKVIVDLLLKNG
jgi:cyanophycin synthetase